MGRGKAKQKDSLIRFSVSTEAKNICSEDKSQANKIGSGIIITHNEKLYLITAGHCNPTGILEDLNAKIHYPQKNIPIELTRQVWFRYSGSDERDKDDIVIYEIKQPNDQCCIDKVMLSDWGDDNEPDNENISFGFPKENRNGTSFDLTYKGNGEWRIQCGGGNPDYNAKELIAALSGSGIIDFKERETYCIGIIRCFSTMRGTYSDILGVKSDVILQLLPKEAEEMGAGGKSDEISEPSKYIERLCSPMPMSEIDAYFIESHPLSEYLKGEKCAGGHKHFILAGQAQTGKSYEMLHAANLLNNEGIPVRMIYLDRNQNLSEDDLMFDPNGVIFLDALDEVKSSKIDNVAETISKFATAHPDRRIIVSCRENFISRIDTGNFLVLTLNDLSRKQVDEYIQNYTSNAEKVFKEINEAGIQELCTNPSNLNYILDIGNETEDGFKLPKSIIEIYEKFVGNRYHTDLNKPTHENNASREENLRLLKNMAYYMVRKGKTFLTHDEMLKALESETDIEELLKNDVVSKHNGEYSFITNGIREYLAAEKLLDLKLKGVKEFVCYDNTDIIRPQMHNTVRLWLSHLSVKDRITDEIIKWILGKSPHLLLACNPETIPLKIRLEVASGILNNSIKTNSLYSFFYLGDYQKLFAFADSMEFREYLLSELNREDITGVHLYNIVCLCACLPWEKYEDGSENDLTPFLDSLFEKIKQKGNEDNSQCLFYWIAYNAPLYSNNKLTDKLIGYAGDFSNPHIMSIMCEIIYKGNIADKYFDYLVKAEKYITKKGDTVIPRTNLYAALGSVKKYEHVMESIKMLMSADFLRKEYYFTEDIFKMTCNLFKTLVASEEGLGKYHEIFEKTVPEKDILYLNDVQKNILTAMENVNDEMKITPEFSGKLHELLHPTPPSEEDIKRKIEYQQLLFELMWNYEDFKEEVSNLADAVKANPGIGWDICYKSEVYGYNHTINEFILQFCGWKIITSDKILSAINNPEYYKWFRLEQTVRNIDNPSSAIEVSEYKIKVICKDCEDILSAHIKQERNFDYRYIQVALKMFVGGRLNLEEDVVKKLLGYSFESYYVGIGDKREKKTVFNAIQEFLGKERFLSLLRSRLMEIIDNNDVIMQESCSFIMENGLKEDKDKLYECMINGKHDNLSFILLNDFLEIPEYRNRIVEDFSSFSPYDKISIWEALKDSEEYNQEVTELLEQEFMTFPKLPRFNALQKLTKKGSMYALKVVTENLDIIKEKGEFFLFYYSDPDSLESLLKLLVVTLEMGPLLETTRRSLISSIGNISAVGKDVETSVRRALGESSFTDQLLQYCYDRNLEANDIID